MSNIICHKSKSAYGRSALGLDSRWLRHREPQLISRCPAREELLASHMVSVGSPVPVDSSVGTRLSTAHTPTRTVCPLQSHLLFPINKWSPRSGLTTQNTAWERDIKQLLAALNVTEEALTAGPPQVDAAKAEALSLRSGGEAALSARSSSAELASEWRRMASLCLTHGTTDRHPVACWLAQLQCCE